MDWNKRFDNIRLAKLDYEEKTIEDILTDLNFDNEDDLLLCKDIIINLESTAVEEINNGNCVQLPYIGSIRKNPLKQVLEQNKTKFKIASKSLSKEGFKEYCADTFRKSKEENRLKDYHKSKIKEARNKYKKQYESYYVNIGKAYAELFLLTRINLRPIEFNQEFEDKYQELYNGNSKHR